MQIKSFKDVEKVLEAIRPDIQTVKWFFALEDMQGFMHALDDPQERVRILHVAGTSGKTSTCYYLASLLVLGGSKTGFTVSPHVDAVNERVQVGGQPLSQTEFCDLFAEFIEQPAVKATQITYFGLLAAFAYWVFAQKQLDYAVVEVGMGGRLDATNVVSAPNKVCVITDIGLDHTKFLGDTLTKIAREKAGIIKPGNEVFVARQSQEVLDVFAEVAGAQNATLHILPAENIAAAPANLPPFQKRNWALAKFAYDFVAKRDGLTELSDSHIQASAATKIPGRMEECAVLGKKVIVDVSHNAQKIGALVEGLQQKYSGQKIAALVSFAADKDVTLEQSLKALHTVVDSLVVTKFSAAQDTKREPAQPETIVAAARKAGFSDIAVESNPERAYELLLQKPHEVLLVTGSFFLLNHIRPLIKKV